MGLTSDGLGDIGDAKITLDSQILGPGEAKAWLEGVPTDDEVTSTVLSLRGGPIRKMNRWNLGIHLSEQWNIRIVTFHG